MTLIKSISGIRGTIGGLPGENLTPPDIVAFTSGFATMMIHKYSRPRLIVGRDGRNSGEMVQSLVQATLVALGVDVFDAGLTTTPSLEMGIIHHQAHGGIMITASHNPMEWNALKFMNEKGEFIDNETGKKVLELGESPIKYGTHHSIGSVTKMEDTIGQHIDAILNLPLVQVDAIKTKKYKVVLDAINSTGALAIPPLLARLGAECIILNGEINGVFNHNPEPLPENIIEIRQAVVERKADLGIIVDPDVDRLALVSQDGSFFGEEYTLVAVADYVLSHTPGNTVSNLSSTLALRDVTHAHGGNYFSSAVGEVNVVSRMKEVDAIIGGEGNGGIIYPELHYGRDAMVGIALFLSLMATKNTTASALRASYPEYEMSKNKIELHDKNQIDQILEKIKIKYAKYDINTEDGVKITMKNEWVHLRRSNTEPIIRIYAESKTKEKADILANDLIHSIQEIQLLLK